MPSRFLEKVPFCVESYKHLRKIDAEKRLYLQEQLLEMTEHSVMASIYMGVMRNREHQWLQEQLRRCMRTVLRLVQITAQDDINGEELSSLFARMTPENARYFRSMLESSLYYYANGKVRKPFEKVLKQPLYLECGIDILASGLQFMLAEFQVRYATPYPHLLADLSSAYKKLMPEMFSRFGLQDETFASRRVTMLESCIERFATLADDSPKRLVLDAWAYLQNSGANWKGLVPQLQADYVLFDELNKSQNLHEKAFRNKRLAIFNHPPLNLLDPSDELFERLNAEMLETYDELAWSGLLDRYMQGQVFMANSPLADLLNDKALYAVLPELCQIFCDQSLDLAVGQSMPCWSLDDYNQPNLETLELARNNKDDYVIAHRYLEGGMGIRVGHVTSSDEWLDFIETFVVDRPYLYVIRDRFPMDPDMSFRALACMNLPKITDGLEEAQIELTDTLYARLTTTPPLGADNHRSFLIFPTGADSPDPDYEFEEISVR